MISVVHLPIKSGKTTSVTQGFAGDVSHIDGTSLYYAIDFAAELGDPVLSVHDGTVLSAYYGATTTWTPSPKHTKENPDPPQTPNDHGVNGYGNIVTVDHGSFVATYAHLDPNSIQLGNPLKPDEPITVKAGQTIGTVGETGFILGAHIHITFAPSNETKNLPPSGEAEKPDMSNVFVVADGAKENIPPDFGIAFQTSKSLLLLPEHSQTRDESKEIKEPFKDLSPQEIFPSSDTIRIEDLQLTGDLGSLFFFSDGLQISDPSGVRISAEPGILLTTGGEPARENTSSSFSLAVGTPGDPDLDEVAKAAFAGAGSTFDALSFELTIRNDDPDVASLSLDLIFGSEEFPEFANTSFVDVAAVFVNGVNYALFNNASDQPLSIIDKNIEAGNFIDNDPFSVPESAGLDIEYDGISENLTVVAPLNQGTNTIKVAVADTGDRILDSGLFVSNLQLLSATGSGLFVTIDGTNASEEIFGDTSPELISAMDGNDIVFPGLGKDLVTTGSGADVVAGTLVELDGDTITDFSIADVIKFLGAIFNQDMLAVTLGSAILEIDADGDGETDSTVTLEGNFENASFIVLPFADFTEITLAADIVGDDGDNFLFGTSASESIQGLAGNDAIKGRGGNDVIDGGAGDDIIKTEDGDDTLIGGPGDDAIYARDGNDMLLGGDGNDHLDGGHGDNQIDGGAGNDKLEAGNGNDTLDGGPGDDRFYAGKGNDILLGGDGNDHLKGAEGDDQIDGGAGVDTIDAGEGDDMLLGGPGDDVLKGRDGNDVLNGGAGRDYLDGGRGADTFLFAAASAFDAVDRIDDYNPYQGDIIDLHELLTAFDPSTDDIGGFARISRSGKHGILEVDADGGGDDFIAIAQIDRGKNLDVQDLIDSDSLLVA